MHTNETQRLKSKILQFQHFRLYLFYFSFNVMNFVTISESIKIPTFAMDDCTNVCVIKERERGREKKGKRV